MKLSELKAKVYDAGGVSTTKQLKAQYPSIQSLDMRYRKSWESALQIVQANKSEVDKSEANKSEVDKSENSASFKDWLSNPPDEYKELFAEAGDALASFGKKLDQTKKLTKTAKAMVASLDEFAEATVEEAQRLISSD